MVPGNYFLEGMKETDKERIAKGNFKNKEGTNKKKKCASQRELGNFDKLRKTALKLIFLYIKKITTLK